MKAAALITTALTLSTSALPQQFEGVTQSVDLPLDTDRNSLLRMSLEYKTVKIEPKHCLYEPYLCALEDYDNYLYGLLTLKGVDTSQWRKDQDPAQNDIIELRLAFNKIKDQENRVFDLLKFTYQWGLSSLLRPTGWECEDGSVNEVLEGYEPNIFWQGKTYNRYYKSGAESFIPDLYQDCIVDNDLTSVKKNPESGLTDFKVGFIRKMKSRGGPIADADFEIGDEVFLDWGFKQTFNKEWVVKDIRREVKMVLASLAAQLTGSALVAIGLLAASN